MSKRIRIYLKAALVVLLINVNLAVLIDRVVNDGLTEMQLFKRIPQTFFWSFKK